MFAIVRTKGCLTGKDLVEVIFGIQYKLICVSTYVPVIPMAVFHSVGDGGIGVQCGICRCQ